MSRYDLADGYRSARERIAGLVRSEGLHTVCQEAGCPNIFECWEDAEATFLIGGALGGVAGVLFALIYTTINPYVGFLPGIKAFTAAVLGGIGNIPGAMIGGFLIGLMETGLSATSYSTYRDAVAFAVLASPRERSLALGSQFAHGLAPRTEQERERARQWMLR